jgi:thiol-disulfide isomerase/thioredoxin
MNNMLLLLLLFFSIKPGICQKKISASDANIATFDLLNNKSFAELEMEDATGRLFNTASLRGKTLYVDFWFTTCPPCLKEIPFSIELQKYFAADTTVVFLSICIDNVERKQAWKQLIKDKQLPGVQLFYARNRPQKINLIRQYLVTFPTYLLVDKNMKVIGYDAPRPSEKQWVFWAIAKAEQGQKLSSSYREVIRRTKEYNEFMQINAARIESH